MLRFSLGLTSRDRLTNEFVRGTAQTELFKDKGKEGKGGGGIMDLLDKGC